MIQSFMVIFAMPAVDDCEHRDAAERRTIATHFVNPAKAATRCSINMCSGSSDIPKLHYLHSGVGFLSSIIETDRARHFRIHGNGSVAGGERIPGFGSGYTTCSPWVFTDGEAYFTAASNDDPITSGVQIFCWLATLWTGRCG